MNEKKLGFDEMPKWFQLVFAFAPIVLLLAINTNLDNDFYFLYPTGEHIVINGFPTTDFLSMHSSMHIIVQQWLCTVLFYFIYSGLGRAGMIAFVYIAYLLLAFIVYRLCMLITDKNRFVSCAAAFLTDLVISFSYAHTRPQMITYIAVALEVLCLEKFARENSFKYLIPLPFISLLVINTHAAMWLMLFIFAAPYGAEALLLTIKKTEKEKAYSLLKLLIAAALCFGAGFINPYGIKSMLYIFSSFGYDEISLYITEMQPLYKEASILGLILACIVLMIIAAVFTKERHFRLRFVLLFAGTLALGIMTLKSSAYFAVLGIPAFTYLVKDLKISFKVSEGEVTKKDRKKRIILIVLLVAALAALGGVIATGGLDSDKTETSAVKTESAHKDYKSLDKVIKILNKDSGDIILYAGFDYGQYLEFNGYHPYIDGRAELFLKDNNGEYDYMKELYDLDKKKINYKDFVNKYNFNYLVVSNKEDYLLKSLKQDKDYEMLFKSKEAYLFKLK
ncbi:MAG: hypothetical protein IJT65_00110 [Eubacterium sp.]|nr:hypothetical protein [Eubacterium sp.]